MNLRTATAATAFLSIKTQFDNAGDALINRELSRLVARRAKTYVDFSRAPAAFEKSMGIDELPNATSLRKHGFALLVLMILRERMHRRECFLFLNPGGLGGGRLSWKARFSALAYNMILSFLAALGVKICQVGISYERMGRIERAIAQWRRRAMFSFCVRDRLSQQYVNSIDMPSDAIVPDLSFNLYREDAIPSQARSRIAISFRFDGKAEASRILEAVQQIAQVIGEEHEYLFIVQVARDLKGMTELQAACQVAGMRTRLIICHDDIDSLATTYSECSAIYSNRLHALLLAAHSGAAPYAVISRGSQPKIEGMFTDLGMADRILFLGEPTTSFSEPTELDRTIFHPEFTRLNEYFDRILGPPLT